MEGIKEFFRRWWVLISASVLIVLYTVFRSKQDTIQQLHDKLAILELEKKLAAIEQEAKKNDEVFKIRSDEYDALKRQHAEIAERLRLGSQ